MIIILDVSAAIEILNEQTVVIMRKRHGFQVGRIHVEVITSQSCLPGIRVVSSM